MHRLGVALGGGGVRGLAHIGVLELLDELGLKPSILAGTSMGAIIGALYASGMTGREIRSFVDQHLVSRGEGLRDKIRKGVALLRWVHPHVSDLRHGGLINPDHFLRHLLGGITKPTFEDLEIPLVVVATDFWTGEEVVLQSGELLPAVRASIAIPGVFPPLCRGDRVLVDGGLVNAVPYSRLAGRCDVTLAVDVGRARAPARSDVPNPLEAILGAFDITQDAAFDGRVAASGPDIHVRARIADVRILDFGKTAEVMAQAQPALDELRKKILEMGLAKGPGKGA